MRLTKKHFFVSNFLCLGLGVLVGYPIGAWVLKKHYEQHLANFVLGSVAVQQTRSQEPHNRMHQPHEAAEEQHREGIMTGDKSQALEDPKPFGEPHKEGQKEATGVDHLVEEHNQKVSQMVDEFYKHTQSRKVRR